MIAVLLLDITDSDLSWLCVKMLWLNIWK